MCPLLEKYGTFIARCNALIEKVSPCRAASGDESSGGIGAGGPGGNHGQGLAGVLSRSRESLSLLDELDREMLDVEAEPAQDDGQGLRELSEAKQELADHLAFLDAHEAKRQEEDQVYLDRNRKRVRRHATIVIQVRPQRKSIYADLFEGLR
eukprot:SAG31_NODE_2059_length_6539_cov_4.699845_4_plen_152_part_00